MASVEHEPITEVWGRAPAGSRGRRGRSPPEAESILVIECPTEPANLAPVRENSMFCCCLQVSELGGARVHGAPNPGIRGNAPPRLRRLYTCLCLERKSFDGVRIPIVDA